MRRAIVLLVVLVGWLFGLAPAALAKGPTTAVIDGPGLASPVRVESDHATERLPAISTLMQRTGGVLLFGEQVRRTPPPPAAELGARFVVTYFMDREPMLTQELYPFAAGGPYTFTPAGQWSIFTEADVPSGWFRAPAELTISLQSLGAVDPGSPAGPAPATVAAADSAPAGGFGAGGWLAGGLALVALVVAVVLATRTGTVARVRAAVSRGGRTGGIGVRR